MDILVTVDGQPIAVEVDGPTHFTHNRLPPDGSPRPLGTTLVRDACLAAAGMRLVAVSHLQWYALEGRPQRRKLLQRLIQAAAASGPPAGRR